MLAKLKSYNLLQWRYLAIITFLVLITVALSEFALHVLLSSDYQDNFRFNGDYYFDADPALKLALQGHIFSMYSVDFTPLMMPLALLSRLPAFPIAELLGIETNSSYQRFIIGTISILSISGIIAGLAALPRKWNWKNMFPIAVVALVVITNPLTVRAIHWGHPEEVLLASLILAAAFSILYSRYKLATICLVAAIATKQPAVLLLPLFYFVIPKEYRWQCLKIGLVSGVIFIAPFIVLDLLAVIKSNLNLADSGQQSGDHEFYLFSVTGLQELAFWARPLSFIVAFFIPYLALRINRKGNLDNLSKQSFFILLPALLFWRCLLDPFNIEYYALPAVISFLALDLYLWNHKKHILQKVAKWPQWLFLPSWTIIGSLFISSLFGGVVSSFADTYLGGQAEDVYVLALSVITLMLTALGLGWMPKLNRSRIVLYGSALVMISIILIITLITYKPANKQLDSPVFGDYVEASPQKIYQRFSFANPVWMSMEPIPDVLTLRQSARRTKIKHRVNPYSYFDYSQVNKVETSTLFNYLVVNPKMSKIVNACHKDQCLPNWSTISSPLGKGALKEIEKNNWEIYLITKEKRGVYIIDNDSGLSPQEAVENLRYLNSN